MANLVIVKKQTFVFVGVHSCSDSLNFCTDHTKWLELKLYLKSFETQQWQVCMVNLEVNFNLVWHCARN